MKKGILTILKYLFFLGLGVFFAWLSVKDIDAERRQHIKSSLTQSKQWLFVPVVFMLLIAHYSRALRWKILMEPLGYKPSNFNTFAAVMIGYLVNMGVPRLGEVVKCTILARYEKIRADKLVGTIVAERAIDLICLIIVFVLTLITQGDIIGGFMQQRFAVFFSDKTGHLSTLKISLAIGISILLILIVYFILKRFGHIDVVLKIKGVMKGVWHGLTSIRLIKHKGIFIFHTLLIWSLYLASTLIGLHALKETSHLGITGALSVLSVGSIGMILTPGGIGAYPLLVAQLIGLYGLEADSVGTALGWLLWSAQTVIIIAGGLVFFALLSAFNKNKV
ncbi:MAG: flippase-like domain-containing protein [Chitinophagaceae bacterium]|nr:flippase-like domain-containing protein [Chitinophagaceae bacterium]